ncbi:MAG TPA: hypothetical protein VGC41_18350 [Kofleriaceae bacterium]
MTIVPTGISNCSVTDGTTTGTGTAIRNTHPGKLGFITTYTNVHVQNMVVYTAPST